MLNKRITFGGDVIPAWIASAPKVVRPERKMVVTPIPGTCNEVVEMEDAWEAYDQPYELVVGDGSENSIQDALNDVAKKLYKTGWQTLTDDYDDEHFRLAYFKGPFDVENRYTRLGKFEVLFRCRAERYLVSGSTPVVVASGGSLTNPTSFLAKPLIRVQGSGSGVLTVGEYSVSFTGLVDYLNVDCDKQDVYRLPSENKNNLMTGSFPRLKPGVNVISFSGGITSVSITPRYWVI